MTLGALLEDLADKGVHLEADGDRIRIRAVRGTLDARDRATLSTRKAELLAYLRSRQVPEPLRPVPREGALPLSFAQQRLWFLSSLGHDGDAYAISAILQLDGALNKAALERALTEIVRRHEVLRTRILTVDGRGFQHIDPAPAAVLQFEDLSDLFEPDARASERARAFATQPFDLAIGPLFRARLWRLGTGHPTERPAGSTTERHMLAMAVHHIVFDGWSLKVIMHELSTLYAAYAVGRASPLPELPVQYADYAAWQRRRLTGESIEQQAAYWRNCLTGAPAESTVPSDHPRPAVATTRGGAVRFVVPPGAAEGVRTLARKVQATPFMILLAAWALLLSRLNGQDDVVVGSPVANRERRECEPLLGLFANTLALRFDLSRLPTLRAFLDQVRTTSLAAHDHQDVPFEQVVDAIAPERQMHHHPIFQTVFVLQGAASRSPLELPGLTVAVVPLEARTAKFDLMLEITETANGFTGELEYNSNLYEHRTAEAIASRWVLLLEAMVQPDATESPLHALPVMTPAERDKLIREWGSNPRPYRRNHTLAAAFADHAERYPYAIAATCGGNALTYRDLDERANRLARHLLATGRVGPDILVGAAVERSLERIVALLGILKAGAAYMPLDPNDPPARLALMVTDDVPLLVTTQTLAMRLPSGPLHVYLDADASLIAQQDLSAPPCEAGPTNLAYALYTSGSTGEPKGVLVAQRSVMRLVDNAGYAALAPDSVVLHLAPLNFDASTFEIWGPLLNGGRLVVMEPGTPTLEEIGATIRREGVNTLWLTAGLFLAMVDERLDDLAPLRQLLAGGDVLSPAHVARVLAAHPHLTVVNGYGPTETTTFATYHTVHAGDDVAAGVPIGRPIGNTHVYVRDRHGELVPPGVAGELFIGGDGVARQYRGRPALSEERFVPDPWRAGGRLYQTGDLVRWRADGVLEFLGRRDGQVKIRGFRVELGEIEAALLRHPLVTAAAVVAYGTTHAGKQLSAYVVPLAKAEFDTANLAAWLSDRLPAYMHPRQWQVLTELPLTPNGKLDRDALPAPRMSDPPMTDVGPQTPVERILADIWSRLLNRPSIGIRQNFFELGGDSILSLQIVARCREAGLRLLPRQIFEYQTIAELAPHVVPESEANDGADQHAITGALAPGPIQRWFHALQLHEPNHFNQSVLLELTPKIQPEVLRQALAALIRHHDMLRLRVAGGDNTQRQWIAAPDDDVPLGIAAPFVGMEHDSIAELLARTQASLDIERGPILRALFFPADRGRTARLLLVIHHLAVDGVSWRILLEDLETACEAVLNGHTIVLPRKTLAFPQWVEKLKLHAASEAVARELEYWKAMPARNVLLEDVPAKAHAANLVGTADKVSRVLAPATTRDLLQNSPRAYGTQIEDMLLTALLLSHYRITATTRLRIDLEGHGRDSFDPMLDLSRTVGWFTCLYPIDLVLEGEGLKHALVSVKEQLRRVPGNGLAYALGRWFMPQSGVQLPATSGIAFNYLGQLDQMLTRTRLMRLSPENSGPNQGPANRRSCLIEILSVVSEGSLRMEWHYHPGCHSRDHIETWADGYLETLTDLVAHCCNSENGGYTPADFSSVALGLAELDEIQALAAASLVGGAP